MTSAMCVIDVAVFSLSKLIPGTTRPSQFAWKCTASPDSSRAPVFGSLTRSDWWPGVWPGVEMMVTLPSPNTSRSPSSLVTGCSGLKRGPPLASGHSYSAFWTISIDLGNSSTLPAWSGWVCEMPTNLMSSGLTPSSCNCAASAFGRFQLGGLAIRLRGNRVVDAGIPQEIALSMLDQVAVVDDVHGNADILAGSPARHVTGVTLPAFEDVHALHALALGEGGGSEGKRCGSDGGKFEGF